MPLPKISSDVPTSLGSRHCLNCGKSIRLYITRDLSRKHFCSHRCCVTHTHKINPQLKNNLALGRTQEARCKAARTRSEKMALGLIPKPPRPTPEMYRQHGLKMRGENHPRWIVDRSQIKRTRFDCSERKGGMVAWRTDVFVRDNYVCQYPGCARGGILNAHHVMRWSQYPELRFDVNNGITLCHRHHPKALEQERLLAPLFLDIVRRHNEPDAEA